MTMTTQQTATLIFETEQFVSLPKVAERLTTKLRADDAFEIAETSLTSLKLSSSLATLSLDLAFENQETVLRMSLDTAPGAQIAPEQLQAQLARLTFVLAQQLPISFVIWLGTDLRIPRERFVDGLSAQFGETVVPFRPVAPRRVTSARRVTERPSAEVIDRVMEQVESYDPEQDDVRTDDIRFDAHVQAYERHTRAVLLRDADEDELEALRGEEGYVPVEARLSTWAVSLSVAAVSLPVAAPVMAYNLARGEDMRVASLAMGLAGFFLALDTSGAMASVC
ncbi:MAG: hypothetical protein QNJ09_06950 [Paracoccaceae bacterium]|nr:hypothetical protein [Paracoccaceae bacterium]